MLPLESKTHLREHDPELAYRWSQQRANEWFEKNGWMVGCNYIPATAINQIEMWQEETFDPFLIDKELGWAQTLVLIQFVCFCITLYGNRIMRLIYNA